MSVTSQRWGQLSAEVALDRPVQGTGRAPTTRKLGRIERPNHSSSASGSLALRDWLSMMGLDSEASNCIHASRSASGVVADRDRVGAGFSRGAHHLDVPVTLVSNLQQAVEKQRHLMPQCQMTAAERSAAICCGSMPRCLRSTSSVSIPSGGGARR